MKEYGNKFRAPSFTWKSSILHFVLSKTSNTADLSLYLAPVFNGPNCRLHSDVSCRKTACVKPQHSSVASIIIYGRIAPPKLANSRTVPPSIVSRAQTYKATASFLARSKHYSTSSYISFHPHVCCWTLARPTTGTKAAV